MAKTVAEDYAELYHYTTAVGLHGIITSQYLRATNISFLNDSEERTHYLTKRGPLIFERAVRNAFDELVKSTEYLGRIDKYGGYEKAIVDTKNGILAGLDKVASFDEPYVVSFCGTKEPRIAQHGLLSQWRAYGADGGYAIVFDSAKFDALLNEEFEKYLYLTSWWGDVNYYHGDSDDLLEEFKESEDVLQSCIVEFLKSSDRESLHPFFDKVNLLSCFTKHWGFYEEREVRIVALCSAPHMVKKLRDRGESRPARNVHHYSRNGLLVPYIRLFEEPDRKLPIKSVIVGPHPEKMKRKKAVEMLLAQYGISADVRVSEIPYLLR
jgi:hypothetical protein